MGFVFSFLSFAAFAQVAPGSGVQQSGAVTANDCAAWAQNGVIKDAGSCGFLANAWSTYTPTVTCGSGAANPTAYTATGRYQIIGKSLDVNVHITITTNGACATSLIVSLPNSYTAIADSAFFSGRNDTNGQMLQGNAYINQSSFWVVNYGNGYTGADGNQIYVGGRLEVN